MAHQIILGYSSYSLEYVDVDDIVNPMHSGTGSNSTQVPSNFSPPQFVDWATSISGLSVSLESVSLEMDSSISSAYYQCKDENYLIECLSCGSFFELSTFCPGY